MINFTYYACVYLEKFTIHPIKEIVPLYYLFNYITNGDEKKALSIDKLRDYAVKLVSMFIIIASL